MELVKDLSGVYIIGRAGVRFKVEKDGLVYEGWDRGVLKKDEISGFMSLLNKYLKGEITPKVLTNIEWYESQRPRVEKPKTLFKPHTLGEDMDMIHR